MVIQFSLILPCFSLDVTPVFRRLLNACMFEMKCLLLDIQYIKYNVNDA